MANTNDVINIAGCLIGSGQRPFIIAELSGNHNQSLKRALALIDAAADAGADAVKLQTYTADTMTLNLNEGDFAITDKNSLWFGRSLYDLYEEAHTPWEWHGALFKKANDRGIIAFSSPFDKTSVDFLETLNVPCYKVASFESTDLPLVRYIASKGKPMIISTGMATVGEIEETVNAARDGGCRDLILLKCTSTYPASAANTNISTIPHMKELFGCEVGLSDHTMGIGVAIASIALGACVIEKHFTLDRSDGGVDSTFSIEPKELEILVESAISARDAMGNVSYGPVGAEKNSVQFRRSIYVVEDVRAGQELTAENIRIIRPGYGLAPKHFDLLLGRKVNQDIKAGTALHWELV
ncbi:MAG: pseudaminic acid synthase [Marinobacter maritimus]|jgi:pseudaminic acid synthase